MNMNRVGSSKRIIKRGGSRKGRHVLAGAIGFLAVAGAIGVSAMRSSRVEARSVAPIPAPQTVVSLPGFGPQQNSSEVTPAPPALAALISTLGVQFGGHVGIAVRSVEEGWTASFNGNDLFPQQSVSKLWVAMTMLDAVDRGKISLQTPVTIRTQDLTLFHQPIAAMVSEAGYNTNIQSLFVRAMTQSDNTANDSVLRSVGGSDAVRGFLARRFISNVRFGPGERLLQSQTAGLTWSQDMAMGRTFYAARANLPKSVREKALNDYLANPIDGAAPNAIVRALSKLKRGEMLSPSSTELLLETMGQARTGPQRVKGGVPAGWHYVHKTGTGQELAPRSTGYNDVGIMTGPDGSSYAIAVMIGETTRPIPERWMLMQSVSRAVAGLHQASSGSSIAAASR